MKKEHTTKVQSWGVIISYAMSSQKGRAQFNESRFALSYDAVEVAWI
jgi:hypothetical protein